jgi:GNAT superfamily N-acetyltransferase
MAPATLPPVRDVHAGDEERWRSLYSAYRVFYRLPEDKSAVDTTWRWVVGREHSLFGVVAVDSADAPIALANLRWFARPSTGTIGLYLDDLYTDEAHRGRGAGAALLARAAEIAGGHGASVVRWITATDNTAARRVYDAHAVATQWVTYDMPPASSTL